MADIKVTKMVMKVDLQCSKCYKKIKRVLCRYPREIRDQVYDQKNNRVFITVVCCSPECIKEKIICKAGETVESIEIVLDIPPEKKPPETKPPETKLPEKKPPETKPPETKLPEKKPPETKLPETKLPEKKPPETKLPETKPPETKPRYFVEVQGWPVPMYPCGICCCCCYEGRPCYQGRGPMCQCSNRGFYASHCCEYFSEENPSGCSIM